MMYSFVHILYLTFVIICKDSLNWCWWKSRSVRTVNSILMPASVIEFLIEFEDGPLGHHPFVDNNKYYY